MIDEGIGLIQDIRGRYDGERRSPFNEAECGHHYARAMASWAAVLALTGFQYHAGTGVMAIRLGDGAAPTFWSTGNAWGTAVLADGAVTVHILGGALQLTSLLVNDDSPRTVPAPGLLSGPQVITM
jgi:hypothetical protein